jgi:hypothetical protein
MSFVGRSTFTATTGCGVTASIDCWQVTAGFIVAAVCGPVSPQAPHINTKEIKAVCIVFSSCCDFVD